ncbi:DUF2147 domain-containing protein [Desulfoluna sp.]|uniref:DUF2147 domain-containing protein n=1 Tax=Desulfoluna sp. TaxID=2045199 RepID=UPI00261AB70A|nr:DUF2147 domain-containing protein [Desulfoluna sp.]
MKRSIHVLFLFFAFCVPQAGFCETSADAIVGHWYTKDHEALVEIFKEGETYTGKIVWLAESVATEDDGTPVLDKKNPDPEKARQPVIGLKIAQGFFHVGGNDWENGHIYDPDNGKTYKCLMKLKKSGRQLKVRGFIGVALLGRNEYWTRKGQ